MIHTGAGFLSASAQKSGQAKASFTGTDHAQPALRLLSCPANTHDIALKYGDSMKSQHRTSRLLSTAAAKLIIASLAVLAGCNLSGNLGVDGNGNVTATLDFELRADGLVQEAVDSFDSIVDSATSVATIDTVGATTVGILDTLPTDCDVVFAIDTTGSMSWAITQVQEDVVATMKKAPNRRYAVVVYRDRADSYIRQTLSPLDGGLDAAIAAINSMKADEGGDFPESVAAGLDESLNQSWDPAKEKHIILIGDAPDHEYPDEATPMSAIKERSKMLGVTIHAVGVPCNDVCKTEIGAK